MNSELLKTFTDFSTQRKILIGVMLPLIFLLISTFVTLYNTSQMKETDDWVDHTHQVLNSAADILKGAVDMETGMRGFLLAGTEDFLEPYEQGSSVTFASLNELRGTVDDNPPQVKLLRDAEDILREWQSNVAEPYIEMRGDVGIDRSMTDLGNLVSQAEGKKYFDQFRAIIANFTSIEQNLLDTRIDDNNNRISATNIIVASVTITAIILGIFLAIFISRIITSPLLSLNKAMKILSEGYTDIDDIDIPGLERKDEIGEMAQAVSIFKGNALLMEITYEAILTSLEKANTIEEFCQDTIQIITPMMKGGYAALYTYNEEEKVLRMMGSYGYNNPKDLTKKFKLGQELVGQCAIEQKTILLKDIPKDYVKIATSLGSSQPKMVVLKPIIHADKILGVIEIASFEEFEEFSLETLDELLAIIALNLLNIRRAAKTSELLKETKQQAEELRVTKEELKTSSEELLEKIHQLEK
ncbi:MAG: GAF domain-containing protein [Kordiimonadaceae bacterium]|nr:GAF domain-containing protein [Kordiimonadaceae bacterium]MBT6330319.1 GAF domain-containing protein [Kordiimonadaceae bacterium]MBT7583186.1 GAF domain-containing protein [Kordiimonadaceae bacterium]